MFSTFTDQEWAQAGRALLALSGVACVGLALYNGSDALSTFLKVWVGGFGLLNVLVALLGSRGRSS
jgi:hypothetical protein